MDYFLNCGCVLLVVLLICECNDLDRFKIENNLINTSEKECLNLRMAPLTEEESIMRKRESNKRYYQSEKGKQQKRESNKRYYKRRFNLH